MPCKDGELCKLPDVELVAPNGQECGHECRGGCGGRLHGLCGEVEDPDGNENHRICHTCFSKRSNLSNAAKRKQEQGSLLQQGASKKINPGASKPRMPANPSAIGAAQSWAELEDNEEIAKALAEDAKEVFAEKMNAEYKEDSDSSDNEEEELNDTGEVEGAGGGKLIAPPPYTELSGYFGPLEQFAESAGNTQAAFALRKAKMAFLEAYAAKPARQTDIRMYTES